jgi:hypothetical protein
MSSDTPSGFRLATDGSHTPNQITVTAAKIAIAGNIVFSATGASLTSITADTCVVRFADVTSFPVVVTATIHADAGVDIVGGLTIISIQDGSIGTRGAGHYYVIGGSWSDIVASAACPGGSPIASDVVTISSGTFVMEKIWTGSAWVPAGTVIDGNVIVPGSITVSKLNTNGLVVRDELGNPIVGINVPLNPAYAAPGTLNNMADVSWWKRGATIPWTQNSEYNSITTISSAAGSDLVVAAGGPKGGTADVWYAKEVTGDGNPGGGWDNGTLLANLDPTKTYRFMVPIMRISGAGESYWGVKQSFVADLNSTNPAGNPYFASTAGALPAGRWMLFVGYIYPAGSTNKTNDGAGIFDCSTGMLWRSGVNFCFLAGIGNVGHRAYQFYAGLNAEQIFGKPVIELVDGSESPIREYFAPGAMLNTTLTMSPSGVLSGPAGGQGQVTLPGMGQNTFRVVCAGGSNAVSTAPLGLYKNGSLVYGVSRSYYVAIIRRSDGLIIQAVDFDVYGLGANTGGRDAGTMAGLLNAYDNNYIAVVWTHDEPQNNRTSGGLEAAMYRCGASRAIFGSLDFKYRGAYVLVGICGIGEGGGVEAYGGMTGADSNAWCDFAFTLYNGNITGVSGNYKPTFQTALDDKLSKAAGGILQAPVTLTTTGGIVSGSLTYNSSGARTGGYGSAMTPFGFVNYAPDGTLNVTIGSSGVAVKGDITGSYVTTGGLSSLTAIIGLLRTRASGARMELMDDTLKAFNASNVLVGQFGNLDI